VYYVGINIGALTVKVVAVQSNAKIARVMAQPPRRSCSILYKPRPGVPALDQNGVAGGVRNHEPGRVRSAAKQFPNVP
jgi:hypothetical protein